jgi:hypothetical protein
MRGRRKRLERDEVEEDQESMIGIICIKLTIFRSLNKIEMRMSRRSCYWTYPSQRNELPPPVSILLSTVS